MEVCEDLNNVSKLLPAILDRVTEINRLEDLQGLLKAIREGILQNDIAFYLMLDIGPFYSLDSISSMRYEQESMGFGLYFLKFSRVRGHIFCLATRERVWDFPGACITPKQCKINFAVPSDTTLKIESSKYNKEIRPGILNSCLDSFSLASPTPISTW